MASPVVASQLAHRDPSQHFAYQKEEEEEEREKNYRRKREKTISSFHTRLK
jgi:hypothetical protein